ncbi:MAG: asparaginase, partial [Gemmatimonadetes bacterium]|nr:asparaginase [Gemmatimonadota bacterium]
SAVFEELKLGFSYSIESLMKKDSLEITDEDREVIFRKVREDPATRILITHGTDTMALTGVRLKEIEGKTIVLTGAMQPAAFKRTDAHFNIGFAVSALQILPPGVYLAMNGELFDPSRARKNMDLDRFEV